MSIGKKKIRVLQVIKSLGRGGAEMLLPETLRVHDKETFEFHYVYFLPWKDALVDSIIEQGGRVTCIPANNNIGIFFNIKRLVHYIKANNIELVHAHLPWAGIVARIAGKMAGVPVIYTEHNKQERYHVFTRVLNLATMNMLSRIIAVSDDVKLSIEKFKSSLTARLQTILNGVNTSRFQPERNNSIREHLGIPKDAPVIGTVSVFRTQKRLDLWLLAAAEILEKRPDARFIVVGDGPLKQELEARRKEYNLVSSVHFPGTQTDVRPYLQTFDIFMMSSIFEGLPIALLEAMAVGCAVVSTDAGGIKEVVRHGVEGYLCPVDHPEELSELAIRILNDAALRKEFSTRARARIVEGFSLGLMVRELEHCYIEEVRSANAPANKSY